MLTLQQSEQKHFINLCRPQATDVRA